MNYFIFGKILKTSNENNSQTTSISNVCFIDMRSNSPEEEDGDTCKIPVKFLVTAARLTVLMEGVVSRPFTSGEHLTKRGFSSSFRSDGSPLPLVGFRMSKRLLSTPFCCFLPRLRIFAFCPVLRFNFSMSSSLSILRVCRSSISSSSRVWTVVSFNPLERRYWRKSLLSSEMFGGRKTWTNSLNLIQSKTCFKVLWKWMKYSTKQF